MRSSPYLPHPAFTTQEHIDEILRHEVKFAIDVRGPSKFRLRSLDSKDHWVVSVGSTQSCTCKDPEVCVHILYVMMRYFGVPKENDILWQRSLTDHEIDQVLNGRVNRPPPAKPQSVYKTKSGKHKVKRLPIGDEDLCPICYDELKGCDKSKVAWCRLGCGGNFHRKCVKMWINSQRAAGKEPLCPICRTRLDMLGVNPPKKPPPNAPPPLTEAEIRDLMSREITPDDYDLLLKLDQVRCPECRNNQTNVRSRNKVVRANNDKVQTAKRVMRERQQALDLQITGLNMIQDNRTNVQRQFRRVNQNVKRQTPNLTPFFDEINANPMLEIDHAQPTTTQTFMMNPQQTQQQVEFQIGTYRLVQPAHQAQPPPPLMTHQARPTSGRLTADPQIRVPAVWHGGGGGVNRTPIKRNIIPPKRINHEHRQQSMLSDNNNPQLFISNMTYQ